MSLPRAFGLGELPGNSISDAADVVLSETGDLVHLPQLSARGIISSPVARTAALLESVHIDRGPRSWVMSSRPQILTRQIRDQLERDLDECELSWGTSLEQIKIQIVGPWTLASRIELSNGHLVITDSGAVRDLSEALILATLEHARDIKKRFRGQVVVQIDEPEMLKITGSQLKGTSDFQQIPVINSEVFAHRLYQLVSAIKLEVSEIMLNQTGFVPNWLVARLCGANTTLVTVDLLRGAEQFDSFGEAISSGMRIGLGTTQPGDRVDELAENPREKAIALAQLFAEIGLDKQLLATAVDVHPRAGITQGTLIDAAGAYRMAQAVAQILAADAADL